MIETLARVPVEVDYASEWRYRNPIVDPKTITLVISQSGETADTIAAQREAKARGSKTLAICNVVGSMITREAAGTIYTHAGPEIGVASTKAFTGQLTALYVFAMYLAQTRGVMTAEQARAAMLELTRIPAKLESILTHDQACDDLAKQYQKVHDFLFLGRGIHYPIALEGALKLKEISYIHAEGYPAGEMKHGPNALIDENLPVVVIATRDSNNPGSMLRYEKTISNLKEVKARSGVVIALATEGDEEIKEAADHVLYVPAAPEELLPILEIVPLQLLDEEWYTEKNFSPDIHVLLVQDTTGMKGTDYARPPFPSTWARLHGTGRVFYTTMGHREGTCGTIPCFKPSWKAASTGRCAA